MSKKRAEEGTKRSGAGSGSQQVQTKRPCFCVDCGLLFEGLASEPVTYKRPPGHLFTYAQSVCSACEQNRYRKQWLKQHRKAQLERASKRQGGKDNA